MERSDTAIFVAVVRAGSFTGAARALGIQKSSVSRRVSELEERLGVRLLQRTTRSLRLTDEGRVYWEHAQRALEELEEAEAELAGMRAAPSGLLRVTAPLSFRFVGGHLGAFLKRYPEVRVELVCTDRVVDLVEEGFDVAIRAGRLPDTSLVGRRLGSLPLQLYASPAYLKRRKPPEDPEDLRAHDCLFFGVGTSRWKLVSAERIAMVESEGRLVVNDYDLLREATMSGAGIALLPAANVEGAVSEGRLTQVLPAWSGEDTPIHALYPSTRHLSAKVRAFVEFLQSRMRG